MQSDTYVEFLLRQGHRIITSEICLWYDAQPRFLFYYPYHRPITANVKELSDLLLSKSCVGLRYFASVNETGKSSYLVVCSDKGYDLSSLDAGHSRRETRRGLEKCRIERVSFKDLAVLGSQPNRDTLVRQGRNPKTWQDERWELYCRAAEGLDGFEAWGAFVGGKLAAFVICHQMEDHFTILHQGSATECLRFYPNNALIFAVTKLKLGMPGVNAVLYGPESLDAPKSLDFFKFGMGFRQRPIKQVIVFHPLVRPFVGRMIHGVARVLAAARPRSDVFRKVEGIVRFYRGAT